MKKSFAISVLLLGGVFGAAHADTSAAAGLSAANYSQSGVYNGANAQSAFNGGGWNAGGFGWQWLQVDLGTVKSISGVSFYTGQLPNGVTSHHVYISNSNIGSNWGSLTAVASHVGYTQNGAFIDLGFAPVSGQYLEIAVNNGPSWTSIGQVEVSTSPIPEPEAYAMLLAGLSLVGAIVRRRNTKPVTEFG